MARPTRPGALSLTVVSILWLFVNKPIEGRTLLEFSDSNGVTESDLVAFAGVLLASWTLWKSPRN